MHTTLQLQIVSNVAAIHSVVSSRGSEFLKIADLGSVSDVLCQSHQPLSTKRSKPLTRHGSTYTRRRLCHMYVSRQNVVRVFFAIHM